MGERGRGIADDSAEILFQCYLQEAIVSSSGMSTQDRPYNNDVTAPPALSQPVWPGGKALGW